ncbi:holin [Vibrio phage Vp670]|uniref:Holin n=2 Tax=Kaohsiungvirus TaxID=2731674 RepID=A0A6B7HX95_9CAUD|nr:holin [Vibrio phage Vp670]APU00140.1 holin [Vibrio phage Vp670]QDF45950.1 holin [Vibrio phage vB_VpaP_MGD2]UFA46039.1 holin [Vibrio phage HH109]
MSEKIVKAVEVVRETLPAAPPAAYVGMKFYGISLPDIVSIATLIYLVIQIGYILYKWRKGI